MTIEQLESEMRQCRKCEGIFKPRFIDPLTERQRLQVRPIFAGTINSPVMLVGQAPGISEYEKGKAFQGQAGQDIRRIFATAGVPLSDFDTLVYQTSITKCFPGRKKVSRKQGFTEEDRQPSVGEISNCIPYLKRQIELIQPQVLVLLGKTAIDGYLRLRGKRFNGDLVNYVGRSDIWNGITAIFFPHTSGSSRWLNLPENKQLFQKAQGSLANELQRRKIVA